MIYKDLKKKDPVEVTCLLYKRGNFDCKVRKEQTTSRCVNFAPPPTTADVERIWPPGWESCNLGW